jgi:hypothetical protein
MKILVSGCSFTAGGGFALQKNDPNIWPNLLASKLNADLVNVGQRSYDNTGIFLNAVSEFTANNYDLILFQITFLNRVVVSPTYKYSVHISYKNISPPYAPHLFSEKEYQEFYRSFMRLNSDFEHWKRLVRIIKTLQNFIDQGYNIKIINGLLEWDQTFFNQTDSNFAKNILNFHSLPNSQIEEGLNIINTDKQQIDLSHWINPFESIRQMQIDDAALDNHPGLKTNKLVADLILSKLNF